MLSAEQSAEGPGGAVGGHAGHDGLVAGDLDVGLHLGRQPHGLGQLLGAAHLAELVEGVQQRLLVQVPRVVALGHDRCAGFGSPGGPDVRPGSSRGLPPLLPGQGEVVDVGDEGSNPRLQLGVSLDFSSVHPVVVVVVVAVVGRAGEPDAVRRFGVPGQSFLQHGHRPLLQRRSRLRAVPPRSQGGGGVTGGGPGPDGGHVSGGGLIPGRRPVPGRGSLAPGRGSLVAGRGAVPERGPGGAGDGGGGERHAGGGGEVGGKGGGGALRHEEAGRLAGIRAGGARVDVDRRQPAPEPARRRHATLLRRPDFRGLRRRFGNSGGADPRSLSAQLLLALDELLPLPVDQPTRGLEVLDALGALSLV